MGARLIRITVGGPELAGFEVELPAASVRLLLASPGESELIEPTWNGNEFLRPDGRRPVIRTLTPLDHNSARLELDVAIVRHGAGVASEWADRARVGEHVALSGPGRGWAIDPATPAILLAGDESAVPAIIQLLGVIPLHIPVHALIEVAQPTGRIALPERANATIGWLDLPNGAVPGDALVRGVVDLDLAAGAHVWAAAEAAAVQRIRRHLFEERGLPRSRATIRGYWKHGRTGAGDDREN